jgi:hypothetical protein
MMGPQLLTSVGASDDDVRVSYTRRVRTQKAKKEQKENGPFKITFCSHHHHCSSTRLCVIYPHDFCRQKRCSRVDISFINVIIILLLLRDPRRHPHYYSVPFVWSISLHSIW